MITDKAKLLRDFAIILGGLIPQERKDIVPVLNEVADFLDAGRNHCVVFQEDGWLVEHSLDCRANGTMPTCTLVRLLSKWSDPLFDEKGLGRFRLMLNEEETQALVYSELAHYLEVVR